MKFCLDVANKYPLVLADPKPAVYRYGISVSRLLKLLFAIWCQQENFLKVTPTNVGTKFQMALSTIKLKFLYPKWALLTVPLQKPLHNEEIDSYANAEEFKTRARLKISHV